MLVICVLMRATDVALTKGGRQKRLSPLSQLPNPHSIDPPVDNDLGMLAVADLAAEDAGAPTPQYRHAGAPDRGSLGGRHRAPSVALAGLARLASG
jgi:hypothetical protein